MLYKNHDSIQVKNLPRRSKMSSIEDTFRDRIATQVSQLLALPKQDVASLISKKAGSTWFSFMFSRLKLSEDIIQSILSGFVTDDHIVHVERVNKNVNFHLNWTRWAAQLCPAVILSSDTYGKNEVHYGKMAIVEYSSPNIAKIFHAGHLRSTIIGNFIKNILQSNGWKIHSMNYLGDWGKQYGLLAIGYERYGDPNDLQRDPIRHLFDVYVKISADAKEDPDVDEEAKNYFRRMEQGDAEALRLWETFRSISIAKYSQMYERLNVSFDEYDGESQVTAESIARVMDRLREKNLLEESDGAQVVPLNKFGLGKAIVEKSDGTSIYLARDMGSVLQRYERHKFDRMIYVVGAAQTHHFNQLFTIMKESGYPFADKMEHVSFGMVKGMSTRRGNVVFLEDILDATRDAMHEVMQRNANKYAKISNPLEVAETVGMSAIYVQDMSARRAKDYQFNWERMLSFEGDTGPYLQYQHARLCSMERETGIKVAELDLSGIDYALLTEPEMHVVLSLIAEFPKVVIVAGETLEPSVVVHYAIQLARAVSKAWKNIWVMNQEAELQKARIATYGAARITLGNALRLIGLKPLERM